MLGTVAVGGLAAVGADVGVGGGGEEQAVGAGALVRQLDEPGAAGHVQRGSSFCQLTCTHGAHGCHGACHGARGHGAGGLLWGWVVVIGACHRAGGCRCG